MGVSRKPTGAHILDPAHVPDIFASDLGRIDMLGKNIRLILYVEQFAEEGSVPENVAVAKIILPIDVIRSAIQRVLFAIGEAPMPQLHTPPLRLS